MSSFNPSDNSKIDISHDVSVNSQNNQSNRTNSSLISSMRKSESTTASTITHVDDGDLVDDTKLGVGSKSLYSGQPALIPATLTTISNVTSPTQQLQQPSTTTATNAAMMVVSAQQPLNVSPFPSPPPQLLTQVNNNHNNNNNSMTNHAQKLNNRGNVTNPTTSSSMLQPILPVPLQPPPPLVVDAGLLRQRQLAMNATASTNGVHAHQQPSLRQSQQSLYPLQQQQHHHHHHLRSGKWLPAEENYALLLVALFERGLIKDCVDGTTTLRTYLSQKLHCAPMRISKKFAGRGIGKLTYTSSKALPSYHDQHNVPELLQRLHIAEQQFLLAAYPPSIAASFGAIPFPLLQVSPQAIPVFPSAVMPAGMVATTAASGNVNATNIMAPPIMVGTTSSSSSSNPIGETTHTTELHKSYLRALEQAEDEPSSNVVGAQYQSVSQPVLVPSIPQPPLTMNLLQVDAVMPKMLSDFQKVAQSMTAGSSDVVSLPNNASQEYSPPFTSRSFDDLHQFLGKDEIPILDTTVSENPLLNQNTHVTTQMMDSEFALPTPAIALDTDALFTAESYALLVKENGPIPNLQAFPIGCGDNVYEVENILQQVQTHRTHHHHEPPAKSETMSSHSSYCEMFNGTSPTFHGHSNGNPPIDVTISHRTSNVGPLSNPSSSSSSSSTNNYTDSSILNTANVSKKHHHVTATSQSEDANIVSGSEPSGGSSSSRSNTSHTSSGTDTAGTTSNEDDGSEEEEEVLTSSGNEFDSAEDDDNHNNICTTDQQHPSPSSSSAASNSPPRKRTKTSNKHQQRSERGRTKKVQFQ